MVLVTLAAVFVALLFLIFKSFEQRRVVLLSAIVINYFVALLCGLAISRPWAAGDLGPLWTPSMIMSVLFITVFYLTGSSAQRAGIAATTVASKMSLVLTVAFSVVAFDEEQHLLGWIGIALAIVGVVLSSWSNDGRGMHRASVLPVLLFVGNAAIDIGLAWTQRMRTTPLTEAVLPTLVFGMAGVLGLIGVFARAEQRAFQEPRTWVGGLLLGTVNYGSLYFVVKALAKSGWPSSSVFPLMNIGVIVFGTLGSMMLFRERPGPLQLAGMATAMLAMVLILVA